MTAQRTVDLVLISFAAALALLQLGDLFDADASAFDRVTSALPILVPSG